MIEFCRFVSVNFTVIVFFPDSLPSPGMSQMADVVNVHALGGLLTFFSLGPPILAFPASIAHQESDYSGVGTTESTRAQQREADSTHTPPPTAPPSEAPTGKATYSQVTRGKWADKAEEPEDMPSDVVDMTDTPSKEPVAKKKKKKQPTSVDEDEPGPPESTPARNSDMDFITGDGPPIGLAAARKKITKHFGGSVNAKQAHLFKWGETNFRAIADDSLISFEPVEGTGKALATFPHKTHFVGQGIRVPTMISDPEVTFAFHAWGRAQIQLSAMGPGVKIEAAALADLIQAHPPTYDGMMSMTTPLSATTDV
jgi:hypothetical protein